MKAYVSSIGESTTEICKWSLERNGFEVVLLRDKSSLAQKLKRTYELAEDDFLRVDADVIPNRHLTPQFVSSLKDYWWYQFQVFDIYKLDVGNGGIQFIRKECLPALRTHINKFMGFDRPETQAYRLPEFNNPRRCVTYNKIMGLHGFAQEDIERVKKQKAIRNQSYDWELYERVEALCSK